MSITGSVVRNPQKPIVGQSIKVDVFGPGNNSLAEGQIAWLKATADVSLLTVEPYKPYDAPHRVQFSVLPLNRFVSRPVAPPVLILFTSKQEITMPQIAKPPIKIEEIGSHAPTEDPNQVRFSIRYRYSASVNYVSLPN